MRNLIIITFLLGLAISVLISQSFETELCSKSGIENVEQNFNEKNDNEPNTFENALEKSITQQQDNSEFKNTVRKAGILYRQAIVSYEQGNTELSKKLYSKAFATLNSIEADPSVHYELKDTYDNLFMGLYAFDYDKKETQNNDIGKYTIPMKTDNELVKKYLTIYSDKEKGAFIKDAFQKSGQYKELITKILEEYNLPRELIYLPIVESWYNNNNLSNAGALGLWQIMPHRARALGLKINYWIDERKDPEKATRAASKYLKDLYILFNDWHLALAAYNRGEFGLMKDLEYSKAIDIEQISKRQASPKETENYVPQFIACTLTCDSYKKWEVFPNKPISYDEVIINDVIDLSVIAKCVGTDVSEIRALNPALKAWCTPPNYPNFKLCIPKGTKGKFFTNIALVKDLNPMPGHMKYKVVIGDCLGSIAKKLFTNVQAIKKDNNISNPNKLKVGQVILVRPGKEYFTNTNN